MKELCYLRDSMKDKIEHFDELTEKLENVYEQLENKKGAIESNDKLNKIKKKLIYLRRLLKDS